MYQNVYYSSMASAFCRSILLLSQNLSRYFVSTFSQVLKIALSEHRLSAGNYWLTSSWLHPQFFDLKKFKKWSPSSKNRIQQVNAILLPTQMLNENADKLSVTSQKRSLTFKNMWYRQVTL